MSDHNRLLPSNHEEFSTKEYWERFFQLQGKDSFEWYGEFHHIFVYLRDLPKDADILVIGCGNSGFSARMYDAGYHNIVNLDFATLIIEEMRQKNLSRSEMIWVEGDMTNMHIFSDHRFDVILDKGALDALVSAATTEHKAKGRAMFAEIDRVLKPHTGQYFCVSLCEDYVLSTLLEYYCSSNSCNNRVTVRRVETERASPFLALLLTITKIADGEGSTAIACHVDGLGNRIDPPLLLMPMTLAGHLSLAQDLQALRHRLSRIELGRFETIPLWISHHQDFAETCDNVPRFTLFVFDFSHTAARSAAVLFIPSGRESDYQLTTADGLKDIAREAGARRLIAVAMNRPHVFGSVEETQVELSPLMLALAPADRRDDEQIPYLAFEADSQWSEIARGSCTVNGDYVVEQRPDEDDDFDSLGLSAAAPLASAGDSRAVVRRLVFLRNQQLVQSEARLIRMRHPPVAGTGAGGNSSGKKKKKSKKERARIAAAKEKAAASTTVPSVEDNDNNEEEEGEQEQPRPQQKMNENYFYDDGYDLDELSLDPLYKAMLAALPLCPSLVSTTATGSASTDTAPSALVIGLGGGCLVMALQRLLPRLTILAAELDPTVPILARSHFGFKPSASTTVHVGDGLALMAELQNKFEVIVIDADSKDNSLGLSAPPREFVTAASLTMMRQLLATDGILVLNVVARSGVRLKELKAALRAAFDDDGGSSTTEGATRSCFEIRPSEEAVNLVLICLNKSSSSDNSNSAHSKAGSNKKSSGKRGSRPHQHAARRIRYQPALEQWLQVLIALTLVFIVSLVWF